MNMYITVYSYIKLQKLWKNLINLIKNNLNMQPISEDLYNKLVKDSKK